MTQNLIQKPKTSFAPIVSSLTTMPASTNLNNFQNMNQKDQPNKSKFIKRITKKTIKHKYTLGKSKIKKVVSVLLKDQNTRKKIQTAQKDLKHHSIHDIKKYLKNHHLIKIGSHAPNDVIRKLYESAMLTGEVTNLNVETILHNFMKDDTND
jgi:metal-responsive CopG/Arc/MetJ family transcriptional regulator